MKFEFLRIIDGPGRPFQEATLKQLDKVLKILEADGPLPNAEIAKRLRVSSLRCAQMCDGLAIRDYITVTHNHKGGRVYELTPLAREKMCAER